MNFVIVKAIFPCSDVIWAKQRRFWGADISWAKRQIVGGVDIRWAKYHCFWNQ